MLLCLSKTAKGLLATLWSISPQSRRHFNWSAKLEAGKEQLPLWHTSVIPFSMSHNRCNKFVIHSHSRIALWKDILSRWTSSDTLSTRMVNHGAWWVGCGISVLGAAASSKYLSRPTRHKIGHFRDVLHSQSLGLVLKNENKRNKANMHLQQKYNNSSPLSQMVGHV